MVDPTSITTELMLLKAEIENLKLKIKNTEKEISLLRMSVNKLNNHHTLYAPIQPNYYGEIQHNPYFIPNFIPYDIPITGSLPSGLFAHLKDYENNT